MSTDDADAPTEFRADAVRLGAPRFSAGDLVAGRYRIVAELGRGGMGQVFRAEDTRLGQPVALKFLPARTARNAEMLDQLAAEVRIGRGVSHPNVCRIYDIVDTAEGLHFIAMELVDGEDLASLLRRIGRFTPERGLGVAHDICQGLAAAHDQGVVHRDLKPANVMIDSRGRARITDFGLATSHGDPRTREIAGTFAYMAPEQLRGDAADVRSDVYALGLVLFEMFTGQRLFTGSSASEIELQHGRPKPAPSSIVRDLPPEIDRAVLACLDERPANRPASARAVAAMLPAAEGASAPAGHVSGRETPRGRERAERSIAVLPFEDLGGSRDDAFTIGLADEIISDLAKVKELRVISRGSVMRFRGAADLVGVGRELQVAYVLNGSILRIGEQLRLNANLVDTRTDEIIWSEKFRGSMNDIFDIQETVARTVAGQLRAHVSAEESARIARRPITDPIAWELVLRARNLMWAATAEALASAAELLSRAESLVGENPAILEVMGSVEWYFYNSRVDHHERRLARAEELASRLATLDPAASGVHRVRGLVAISRGEWKRAMRELREAVDHDANEIESAFWLLLLYAAAGRNDLARRVADHLRGRDPFGLASLTSRAYFAFFCREDEAALQLLNLADDLYPFGSPIAAMKGTVLLQLGRREEALRVWSEHAATSSDNIFRQLSAFLAAGVSGDRASALRVYHDTLEHNARDSIVHGAEIAIGLAGIGEIEASVDWLENAIRHGFFAAERVERSPLVAPILGDPRIRDVLARMRAESAAVT